MCFCLNNVQITRDIYLSLPNSNPSIKTCEVLSIIKMVILWNVSLLRYLMRHPVFCYMLWVSWPPPALPTINQSNFYSRLFSSGFSNVFSAPRNVRFHYILKIKTYMLKARVMESAWESSIIKIELAPQFLPLELHPCSIIDPHVRCLPCEFSQVGFIFSISMQEHMLLCIIDANMHVWCK